MIYMAIMGHGVVGSGVAEILLKHTDSIARKAGQQIEVAHILDLREFPDSPLRDRFTKNFEDIVEDERVSIVVETMGGLNPSYDFVKRCLQAGKSVVTSNKELVARYGDELLEIARERNLNFLFEASVGGGIPILRPIDQCLAANEVSEIAGILNGTTNFMLTKMVEDSMSFDDALSTAQRLGYAERDPAADIGGFDASRKICILAALAFGKHVYPDQVHTEGIEHISLTDVQYAAGMNSVIKLIGRAKRLPDGHVSCLVAPMVLTRDNLLSDVRDVFNGIMVRGDSIGDVMFYGRGAGKLPTASAVVADVIDEVKHIHARKYLFWERGSADYVQPFDEYISASLVRVRGSNTATALAAANAVFGELPTVSLPDAPEGELAFVTPPQTERDYQTAIASLRGMDIVSRIRLMK